MAIALLQHSMHHGAYQGPIMAVFTEYGVHFGVALTVATTPPKPIAQYRAECQTTMEDIVVALSK